VAKNYAGHTRWKTCPATEQVIRGLARIVPDAIIASILNKLKIRTAKGHTWTRQRVTVFRNDNHIAVYHDGERAERGEVVVREAAASLAVSKMTVIRLIKDGLLPAKQVCFGAPYVIQQADLDLPAVRRAIKDGRSVSHDPRQGTLELQ
jgi:excisionase family DNA binding protein